MTRADDRADDRKDLAAIERRLVDDDPALAEAFQEWQMPEEVPDARDGGTTVPPWVLAIFVTAAVSWVLSPGFGVLAAVLAFSWVSLGTAGPGGAGRRWTARGGAVGGPGHVERPDDGGLPPSTWRGGWM
jgi:hypothetical protein